MKTQVHGISGAQFLVERLAQLGVQTLFGYPGGAIMPVYDALYDSELTHILCRHEQGAALAAVGYARASGRVGVCLATSGPGATNLITGLADAMLDSIPVVAITGQVPTAVIGTDAFQEVDMLGLSLSVTKHSIMVESIEQLPDALQQAFDIATSGRPGPVLIDLPKDVQQALLPSFADAPTPPAEPDISDADSAISQAMALLQQAKQPLAYVGGGVGMAGAVPALRQFLHETGMPVVSTLKGLGAVSPAYAGNLGMLGMHGTKAANLAVQSCDLLIAIGARFDDRVTGKLDTFAPNANVIHLDVDPAELNKLRTASVSLQTDLKRLLPQLSGALDISQWQQHCRSLLQQHQFNYKRPGDDIFAPQLLRVLSDRLPTDRVISCDVGQHQMWVAQHMQFEHPNDHLSSAGLGTMGFGLPAAIGAKLSRPDSCVVNVSGDGSFMMNVQELATLNRYQIPVKMLLLDNQRLGMVRQWQSLFFEQRYSETELMDNPDFVALAQSCGIPGESISQQGQMLAALQRMIDAPGPYLLHVRIDAMNNVWPLVPPGAANQHMLDAMPNNSNIEEPGMSAAQTNGFSSPHTNRKLSQG